jgi:hypothetical protein
LVDGPLPPPFAAPPRGASRPASAARSAAAGGEEEEEDCVAAAGGAAPLLAPLPTVWYPTMLPTVLSTFASDEPLVPLPEEEGLSCCAGGESVFVRFRSRVPNMKSSEQVRGAVVDSSQHATTSEGAGVCIDKCDRL